MDVSARPGACSGRRGSCVAVGFLGGAVVGVGVGAFLVSGCDGDLCGLYYLFSVPAGALFGTIVGAVVGGEHWNRAELPARLGLAPGVPGAFRSRPAVRAEVTLSF